MNAICRALELFCLFPAKILVRLLVFLEWKLTANQSQQSTSSVYLFQNRSEHWMFPVETVALWVNRKPNKEFDLQMTGSQRFYSGTTHNNFSPIFHKFNPQKVLQNSGEYEHRD